MMFFVSVIKTPNKQGPLYGPFSDYNEALECLKDYVIENHLVPKGKFTDTDLLNIEAYGYWRNVFVCSCEDWATRDVP